MAFSTNSSRPFWINAGDLNNDTVLEIITADWNRWHKYISWIRKRNIFPFNIYTTGYDSLPFAVVAGDFNIDNHLDLVTNNCDKNSVDLLLSNRNGILENETTFSVGPAQQPCWVVLGHFNDDTILDIAVADHGTNNIGVFLANGSRTLACLKNVFHWIFFFNLCRRK